ncbi:MAG: type II toxin-antitoxin system RelE/ParE family toxin [Candidatus Thiodiazotropha sp.]
MIQSFNHKGFERFFKIRNKYGIQAKHANRIRLILGRLNASTSPADMDLPGLYLQQLTGDRQEIWSVRVSGDWLVTFRFNDVHAEVVDYGDYH